eukprot:GHVL01006386.1.p1 GENE.GHVL01006386.1~~GHVL01006386.1.p1  ORF type:complete len:527 (+),score=101.38 GHVL01006386.1:40-1620(+)
MSVLKNVISSSANYNEEYIESTYTYSYTRVVNNNNEYKAEGRTRNFQIRCNRKTPKIGVMLVGLGGNNGTTFTAGILANRNNLTWETKEGLQKSNYLGSITQSSTIRLGINDIGHDVYVPIYKMLPMINPTNLCIGGWDISKMPLGDAMKRAKVIDINLQNQLYEEMQKIHPLPAVSFNEFIADNQSNRTDNILKGTKEEQLNIIRNNISDFKKSNKLDKVIIMWTANTEKFVNEQIGIHDKADNLLNAIKNNHKDISSSIIYCVAAILEGCAYINGSPQNTLVAGIEELAVKHNVFIGGNDFKSGQTKIKSVLVDFLVSAGIKPEAIVSYNHLGNNDGENLSSPEQFKSKEISKSSVVKDMVESNDILYPDSNKDGPDHCVVIKYVPFVGDSKRAMDEYNSRIFMNGINTIVMHNTCEDSLLAAPLIIDLIVVTELAQRIQIREVKGDDKWESLHSVFSLLSYWLKAPAVQNGAQVVNALFRQRECFFNFIRACVGLPPDNYIDMHDKLVPRKLVLGEPLNFAHL